MFIFSINLCDSVCRMQTESHKFTSDNCITLLLLVPFLQNCTIKHVRFKIVHLILVFQILFTTMPHKIRNYYRFQNRRQMKFTKQTIHLSLLLFLISVAVTECHRRVIYYQLLFDHCLVVIRYFRFCPKFYHQIIHTIQNIQTHMNVHQ